MKADKQRAGKDKELQELSLKSPATGVWSWSPGPEAMRQAQWFQLIPDGMIGVKAVIYPERSLVHGQWYTPKKTLESLKPEYPTKSFPDREPQGEDGKGPCCCLKMSHDPDCPQAKEGGTPSPHPGVEEKY